MIVTFDGRGSINSRREPFDPMDDVVGWCPGWDGEVVVLELKRV